MIGPESLTQFKDRISGELIEEYFQLPEESQPGFLDDISQRLLETFVQNGLRDNKYFVDYGMTCYKTRTGIEERAILEIARKMH